MAESFQKFSKLELHAHLNGSLSEETVGKLRKLHGRKNEGGILEDFTAFNDLSSCFDIFKIAHNLTNTAEAVSLATTLTIQEFAKDGVIYLELRSTPRAEEGMTKKEYLHAIIKSIMHVRDTVPEIYVNLIVSINRSEGVSCAEENLGIALSSREKYKDVVVGIDLSGDPTKGNFSDFVPVLEKARTAGFGITLHCGEVSNPEEVDEMLNFAPHRLGHVTCLTPRQRKKLRELKLPVELCLTSNVKCGTVPDYGSHHLKYYNNHPYILATDDKGVFSTTLTQEYEIAHYILGVPTETLREMNYRAVDFIFASEDVRAKLRTRLTV